MDTPRDDADGPDSTSPPRSLSQSLPTPALYGFVLLLALMFAASYAVGRAAGPVAPGMHDTSPAEHGGGGGDMDMDHGGGH
ncbi:hypothetical protein ABZ929_05710 [Streptomyces physcomitrii]|uniref:hypothetical protein n=1 Tax=Streptomyces physcomitrii TaxID=2724184 RepID=UPI0033BFF377